MLSHRRTSSATNLKQSQALLKQLRLCAKRLIIRLPLIALLAASLPLQASESVVSSQDSQDKTDHTLDYTLDYTLEHFSYAGPMAVMQLANDWNGKLKSGKDAISFIQSEISARYKNFTLGYLVRKSHQFKIGSDLARGFYYYNNDITLAEQMQINAKMQSKVYAGKGLRLTHTFHLPYLDTHHRTDTRLHGQPPYNYVDTHLKITPGNYVDTHLKITPGIVVLRLDEIIWGGFDGSLFYSSPDEDDWGGTIDLDYGYTKDFIARRPLEGEHLGWLYGLDLDVEWSSPWLEARYSGINVFSRIYWKGMPRTTAKISTESAFYLIGPEYFDDAVLNAPALHYLEASTPLTFADSALKVFLVPDLYAISQNMHLFSSAQITPIRSFYYHGFQYRTKPGVWGSESPIKLGLQHDFSTRTTKLSMQHEYVSMEFASQTMDVSESQQVVLKLGLHVSF